MQTEIALWSQIWDRTALRDVCILICVCMTPLLVAWYRRPLSVDRAKIERASWQANAVTLSSSAHRATALRVATELKTSAS